MFTVGQILSLNRQRYPEKVAFVDETGALTWREVVDRAWAVARGLREQGVVPGDHVGLLAGNGNFGAVAYLGIVTAGAVCVQYNWRWAVPELVAAVEYTEPKLVIVDNEYAGSLEMARESLDAATRPPAFAEGPAFEQFLRPGPNPEAAVTPSDPNVIIFTGGTTGASKGVVLTHQNVLANAFNEIVDTDMEPDDRTLIIAPMFHSGSLLCWFLPHVVLGATCVFHRGFDEERVAAALEEDGVTNGFFVPNMVRRMLLSGVLDGRDVLSFQRLYVGGATFELQDRLAAKDAFPAARLYYQYGLTEAGPIVTRLRPEDFFRPELTHSIGKEFLLAEVSLRDESDAPVANGEIGEICVRGPGVMAGYYAKPEATEAALRGGWLHTGDVASRDDEGFIYFHDRIKDMIKTGGENVYSAEIEQVLYQHPAIAEAAVVGVASSDWDEEVRAVVALRPDGDASEQEVRDYCRQSLAGYKVPKRVAFIPLEEMPINQTGKVLKTELRERALWADSGSSR